MFNSNPKKEEALEIQWKGIAINYSPAGPALLLFTYSSESAGHGSWYHYMSRWDSAAASAMNKAAFARTKSCRAELFFNDRLIEL